MQRAPGGRSRCCSSAASVGSRARPDCAASWPRSPDQTRWSPRRAPSGGSFSRAWSSASCWVSPSTFVVPVDAGTWRWLALSPRLFASVLAPGTADPANLFAGGLGGGALGVPLFEMAGGYAIASRGRRWARAVCASLALVPIPAWVIVGNADGADVTASEAWIAVHFWSLLAVLAIASAIPHRPIAEPPVGIS